MAEARLGARADVCRQRLLLALLVNSRHVPGLAAFRCRRGSETCARSDRCSRPYRSSAPFRWAVSVQGRWRLARSAGMPASVQESVNLHAPDCRTIDRLLESDTDQAESHVRERGSSDVRCSIGFLDRRTWRRVLVGVRVPWPCLGAEVADHIGVSAGALGHALLFGALEQGRAGGATGAALAAAPCGVDGQSHRAGVGQLRSRRPIRRAELAMTGMDGELVQQRAGDGCRIGATPRTWRSARARRASTQSFVVV
jgi:hypothetical protein